LEVRDKATPKTGEGVGVKPQKLSVFHYPTANVACNFEYSF